ncbi:MAG: Amidase enhancer precursor [Candidatus Aminicenantes bacterium ADurb.Bin508]|nr:MAG: Amidase enhancer precursor [Candidatus Aminicenantes bacterium ADurb.Bin508]
MEVQGIEGSKRFEGIKIKTILGLRDLNFFLDREFGPSGEITGLTFLGRGWGHGVGLCQVGAYGMAKEGSKYKEILLHYYPGTRVENLSKVEKRE